MSHNLNKILYDILAMTDHTDMDFYSIGVTLFQALIIRRQDPQGHYQDTDYAKIAVYLRDSALIQSSPSYQDVTLLSLLTDILKKCLARNERIKYVDREELKADLNAAIRRIQFLNSQDSDENEQSYPAIALQKLLYDHPLFEIYKSRQSTATRTDCSINVLVIGAGTFGQAFIDQCLQAGQIEGYALNIIALSNTPKKDKEIYLTFRPDLDRFVNVNGSITNRPNQSSNQSYGTLNFLTTDLSDGDESTFSFMANEGDSIQKIKEENHDLVNLILDEGRSKNKDFFYHLHYIFIALGNDRLNQGIAEILAEEIKETACPICYIQEKKSSYSEQDIIPVYINAAITPEMIDPQLDKMAFNTDLSWNSSLNLDITRTREEFYADKQYRYSSSLAFAFSVKYKLFSLDILTDDANMAADEFYRKCLKDRKKNAVVRENYKNLVVLEHRRWVLEKVTSGWTAPRKSDGALDLEGCVSKGYVKNEKELTHPCIVFSKKTTSLSEDGYSEKNNHRKWEEKDCRGRYKPIEPDLDELDNMSVELHRCFRDHADQYITSGQQKQDEQTLYTLTAGCGERTLRAYHQFRFCIRNILSGVDGYTRQYDYYQKNFQEALLEDQNKMGSEDPHERESRIITTLDKVKNHMFPVIEANLYRNYKANDETLIKKIPFILTCHLQPAIAMALEDGGATGHNDDAFSNVAAITVLSPSKIYYLYYYNKNLSQGTLKIKISAVLNYLDSRKVQCNVNFAIACNTGKKEEITELFQELRKEQVKYSHVILDELNIQVSPDKDSAAKWFQSYLLKVKQNENYLLYDGSTKLFKSAISNTRFISWLIDEQHIPYFEFDHEKKNFTEINGDCAYLRYMKDNSFLRVSDMFSLMNAVDIGFNLPEYEDYEKFWQIYTGNKKKNQNTKNSIRNWTRLCNLLSQYEDQREVYLTLNLNWDKTDIEITCPADIVKTAKKILDNFIELQIVSTQSYVENSPNGKEYILHFEQCLLSRESLIALFADSVKLSNSEDIDIRKIWNNADCKNVVEILYHGDLFVENVDLTNGGNVNYRFSYETLQELEKEGFIKNLKLKEITTGEMNASFEYSAARIKKLLTKAGMILEIYVYYQAMKTGYFDDIVCGYEFRWQETGVKNELDLVLTKGFCSMIVECKATEKLDQIYYEKLDSLADNYGIGNVKVLVAGNYSDYGDKFYENNEIQRKRGEQTNIATLYTQEDIDNIGDRLKKLMTMQC